MRSTVPLYVRSQHGPAFELTCVCLSAEAHIITHTLLHECDRTYSHTIDRTHSRPSRDPF
jgi:hypothetical protein